MEKMRWKLLRSKFVRLVMLFFLVLGISFFMYGGCNNDGEVCFFVDGFLDLGLADDAGDCISAANDFDCDDFLFDLATGDCDGIDCIVCEDGACNLALETFNDSECIGLEIQFDCDNSIFVDGICTLEDCNLCLP